MDRSQQLLESYRDSSCDKSFGWTIVEEFHLRGHSGGHKIIIKDGVISNFPNHAIKIMRWKKNRCFAFAPCLRAKTKIAEIKFFIFFPSSFAPFQIASQFPTNLAQTTTVIEYNQLQRHQDAQAFQIVEETVLLQC